MSPPLGGAHRFVAGGGLLGYLCCDAITCLSFGLRAFVAGRVMGPEGCGPLSALTGRSGVDDFVTVAAADRDLAELCLLCHRDPQSQHAPVIGRADLLGVQAFT